MTGQFFFALLNPVIALVLAVMFFILWRKRPARRHFMFVSIAFACCGLAFIAQDFLQPFEGPVLRIFANGLFFAAILLACCSTLIRIDAPIPAVAFTLIGLLSGAAFFWFLLIDPSVTARIYILNAAYAVFAVITGWHLLKAKPRNTVDWLGIVLMAFLFVIAVSRPLATLMSVLDVNAGGDFQDSTYWATVQALTPLLALATAFLFLAAMVLELVGELRSEADRDYLTGLLNRRGFERHVAPALQATDPALSQPALMLIDIDNFKIINDSFGHAVGDEVIAAVAGVLSAHGAAALVARTGGEEFALFYTDSRRAGLLAQAQIIRFELTRVAVAGLPPAHPLTVSIGIQARHQAEPLSDMMTRADRALYEAKLAGKDRAVMAPLPLRSIVEHPARAIR